MSAYFVLAGFALIVFSPCLVALNSSVGEASPVSTFVANCKLKLRRIL